MKTNRSGAMWRSPRLQVNPEDEVVFFSSRKRHGTFEMELWPMPGVRLEDSERDHFYGHLRDLPVVAQAMHLGVKSFLKLFQWDPMDPLATRQRLGVARIQLNKNKLPYLSVRLDSGESLIVSVTRRVDIDDMVHLGLTQKDLENIEFSRDIND